MLILLIIALLGGIGYAIYRNKRKVTPEPTINLREVYVPIPPTVKKPQYTPPISVDAREYTPLKKAKAKRVVEEDEYKPSSSSYVDTTPISFDFSSSYDSSSSSSFDSSSSSSSDSFSGGGGDSGGGGASSDW